VAVGVRGENVKTGKGGQALPVSNGFNPIQQGAFASSWKHDDRRPLGWVQGFDCVEYRFEEVQELAFTEFANLVGQGGWHGLAVLLSEGFLACLASAGPSPIREGKMIVGFVDEEAVNWRLADDAANPSQQVFREEGVLEADRGHWHAVR